MEYKFPCVLKSVLYTRNLRCVNEKNYFILVFTRIEIDYVNLVNTHSAREYRKRCCWPMLQAPLVMDGRTRRRVATD
jgi:hypothetical protein